MRHPLVEKLKVQLKAFMHELHVDIPKQLQYARSLGDLSENAEYKMTKERQLYVESRIKHLEDLVQNLQGLNLDNLPEDRIAYGTRVTIEDLETGEEKTYLLAFDGEDPLFKKDGDIVVTMGSPIARALAGKREGDEVKVRLPKGVFDWEIIEIETFKQLVD